MSWNLDGEVWFRRWRDETGVDRKEVVHWKGCALIAICLAILVAPQVIWGVSQRFWGLSGPVIFILVAIHHTEDLRHTSKPREDAFPGDRS